MLHAHNSFIELNYSNLVECHDDIFDHFFQVLREVRAMARLSDHPNIVRFFHAWVENVRGCELDIESEEEADAWLLTASSVNTSTVSAQNYCNRPTTAVHDQCRWCSVYGVFHTSSYCLSNPDICAFLL